MANLSTHSQFNTIQHNANNEHYFNQIHYTSYFYKLLDVLFISGITWVAEDISRKLGEKIGERETLVKLEYSLFTDVVNFGCLRQMSSM